MAPGTGRDDAWHKTAEHATQLDPEAASQKMAVLAERVECLVLKGWHSRVRRTRQMPEPDSALGAKVVRLAPLKKMAKRFCCQPAQYMHHHRPQKHRTCRAARFVI